MRQLVPPTLARYDEWQAAREEWGPGLHEDGFGLTPDDDPTSVDGFATWLARLGRGAGTCWWILDGASVAGGIALRANDDPDVLRHGHIGYGIRPSFRGRGLATWAMGQVLVAARARGLDRVLVVCAADNVASARVVAHHGGCPVDAPHGDAGVRRFWVATARGG